MMRPFMMKIGPSDFALAGGHRRIAISLLASTLNSATPFSIAGVSDIFGFL
jgi:hypothetical protein